MSVIKPAIQHPEKIAYFSGANNYCWLHFRNGEKKLLAKPISSLETQLPDFIRVHKTILLNPAYIKELQQPPRRKMTGKVCLDTGEIFPVSRRRWNQVVELLLQRQDDLSIGRSKSAVQVVPISPEMTQPTTLASIWLITDDADKVTVMQRLIEKSWPGYYVHTAQRGDFLVDLIRQLPKADYPTLLLLDATSATTERLQTLRQLKNDPFFNRIPVILLVPPADLMVIEGYSQRANSVISIPMGLPQLEGILASICQFWLRVVALPAMSQID
ncbi:hypothetical protein GCM10028807_16100 [Spirosoma daeguense]